jgi:poly(3-hydroxyoctanoate) depolymerase
MAESEQSMVSIPDGVRVRFFEGSPGTRERPILLVNGIGAGVDHWGGITQFFAGPSCAVDVAGTSFHEARPSMSDYSDALVRTIDALDFESVDLLGVSWGGSLALHTARRHNDRVDNLMLGVTTFGMGAIPPKLVALLGLMSADRTSETFYRRAPDIFGGDIRRDPYLLRETGITRQIDQASYDRQKQAIMRWSRHITSSLLSMSQIKNPTLILAGEDDPLIHPVNARLLALAIRNAELHLVPGHEGGGHLLLHTRPQKCATIIEDFLNSHQIKTPQ